MVDFIKCYMLQIEWTSSQPLLVRLIRVALARDTNGQIHQKQGWHRNEGWTLLGNNSPWVTYISAQSRKQALNSRLAQQTFLEGKEVVFPFPAKDRLTYSLGRQ